MNELEQLRADLSDLQMVVQDLVETLRDHTKELERFFIVIDQQTDLRDTPRELPIVISRLNELRRRMQRIAEREPVHAE